MLCHPYRCIYIHIPKAAGQSIHEAFARSLGMYWKKSRHLLLEGNKDPQKGPPALAHLKASQFVSCGYVSQEDFDRYFKFSFVRNPWDRIVSEYKYRGYASEFDFKTFLFDRFPQPSFTDRYWHTVAQFDFLHDEKGKLLVDFVGKFEKLEQDFSVVCRHLQIRDLRLPHKNKSTLGRLPRSLEDGKKLVREWIGAGKRKKNTHGHYSAYYDDESREFVAELYRKDIEAFGYQFEDRASRFEEADRVRRKEFAAGS